LTSRSGGRTRLSVCRSGRQDAKVLRSRLASLADDLVEVIASEAGAGHAGKGTGADLDQHVDRFRPIAWESAGDVLSQEIDRAISER